MTAADFPLKIRLQNVLWSLGFCTRIEVKLAQYSGQLRLPLEVTDLDVLGIRILPELTFDFLVADCTTDKTVVRSPIQRVFWLRGVMDFFGAAQGFLAFAPQPHQTPTPDVPAAHRAVAHRLAVTILSPDNLSNLERRVLVPDLGLVRLGRLDTWQQLDQDLQSSPKDLENLLRFRRHTYWMNRPYQNLHALISIASKHRSYFQDSRRPSRSLAVDLLSLFAIALIHMASYVAKTNPEDAQLELRAYFYGGHPELRRRQATVDEVRKLVRELSPQANLLEPAVVLDPSYLNTLFEVGFRLVNRPADAAQIPRYLQLVLAERVLTQPPNPDGEKYLEEHFSDVTRKLTKDIAHFFTIATGFPETVFADLF